MSSKGLDARFSTEDKEKIIAAGMDLTNGTRKGTFVQEDSDTIVSESFTKDVEILSVKEAAEKISDFQEYWGKAFDAIGKEYDEETDGGYFIRVKAGAKVEMPIQACMFIKKQGITQKVHNVIIIEPGASVYLITGCASAKAAKESAHLGLSEFYVKAGGYLNFTMIHSWDNDVVVKPMSAALVEEGASFISNYICLDPVKDIKMYPTAVLRGERARASFNSLIVSHEGTLQDIGSRVIFQASNTQAEIVSRVVSLGGKIIARGHLNACADKVKAHLECRGLILSERGNIHAIPELETGFRDVDMSHEAAIGKISKEEIEYLCSRGITEEEAQSIIIRGFMDVDILGLPEIIKNEVKKIEEKTLREGL